MHGSDYQGTLLLDRAKVQSGTIHIFMYVCMSHVCMSFYNLQ